MLGINLYQQVVKELSLMVDFQYSVDAKNRRTTKTPLLGDPRGRNTLTDQIDPRNVRDARFSGFVNEELGI